MKIGELGRATATNVETIRYYERVGLLPPPERTEGNYRTYDRGHVQRLSFIRHARGLGFDLNEIGSLLDLSDQPERDCDEVDRIATGHLEAVEAKIAQLEKMRGELARMVGQCRGGRVSTCHVLEVLADHNLCATDHTPAGTVRPG